MVHTQTRMREIIVATMLSWILVLFTLVAGQEDLSSMYVGCFHGDEISLTSKRIQTNVATLSIATCISECLNDTSNPMTFAGLTNGTACFCMNDTGVQVPDTTCSANCSGSSSERCGGIGPTTEPIYSIYTVCPIGYFGRDCNRPCHCKWQLPCDRNTGFCEYGCEKHWRGTSCSTRYVNTTLEYIGCFKDRKQPSALEEKNPGGKTGEGFQNTTIDVCIDICASWNVAYSFAGLQYHYDCWCGNQYDRYRSDATAVCDKQCRGNRNQMCGGAWANSVYNVCPAGFYGRNCLSRCNCNNHTERCNYKRCSSSCKPGWKGESCNVRDCSINNGDCGLNVKCEEVDLGHAVVSQCRCKIGYIKVGNKCNQDECQSGNNSCNVTTQDCLDTVDGYTCGCKRGFEPEPCSNTCIDVNECEKQPDACNKETQTCHNSFGSYVCLCKIGFKNLTDGDCIDIDECADNTTCSSAFNCTNTVGSFYCSYCPMGYINGVGECEIPLDYSAHDVMVVAACSAACMALISLPIAVLFLQHVRRYRKKRQQNGVPHGEPVAYYTTYAETSDEPAYSTVFEGTSKEPSYYSAMRQAEGRGEHDYTTISA